MQLSDVNWHDITLFKGFSRTVLNSVRSIFEIRSLDTGDTLIVEGEDGDEMFILIEGRVRISKSMLVKGMDLPLLEVDNQRKVLATLDQTDYPIFGEVALLDRDRRSATIRVLEPSHFLVTDRDKVLLLMERDPATANKLLFPLAQRMAATIRKNNGELVKLSTALALALSRVKDGAGFR